ncbi:hypothetical protein [Brucella pituitosa]|uniref:hypothetical protein n=1 Tax=Brucella pituitosa TaxID=571256 RepID=UPI00142D4078|nr:hypothetical protein [Brucella pituitosa]
MRVVDTMDLTVAEKLVTTLLKRRHGEKDFAILNTSSLQKTIETTTAPLALPVSSIAGISLLVGNIGVMNTMFVSDASKRSGSHGNRCAAK